MPHESGATSGVRHACRLAAPVAASRAHHRLCLAAGLGYVRVCRVEAPCDQLSCVQAEHSLSTAQLIRIHVYSARPVQAPLFCCACLCTRGITRPTHEQVPKEPAVLTTQAGCCRLQWMRASPGSQRDWGQQKDALGAGYPLHPGVQPPMPAGCVSASLGALQLAAQGLPSSINKLSSNPQ